MGAVHSQKNPESHLRFQNWHDVLHVAVWNGVASLGVVEARVFGPLEMLFIDVSIGVADGGLYEGVGNRKRLQDVQDLRPDLEVQFFYGFEDVL